MKTKTHYPTYSLTFEEVLCYGDNDLLRDLLDKGLSPNSRVANGEWLIIGALKHGTIMAEILQQRGADMNVCTLKGDSAFLAALPHVGTWRLEEWWPQADVNAPRHDGLRPLHIAVGEGDTALLRWLRDKGADISLPNERGETALDFCRRLMEETEDKEKRAYLRDCEHALTAPVCAWQEDALQELGLTEDSSQTLYKDALYHGDIAAVRRLLTAGADPNAALDGNKTRPMSRVYDGDASLAVKHELLRLLAEYGAEPSEGDADDYSVLLQASDFGDAATVELMLELGGNPYRPDFCYDETALCNATANEDYSDPALIQRLLELGINVNAGCDYLGHYPLSNAIFHNDIELVRTLLDRGAHPFFISQNKQSNMMKDAEENIRYCSGDKEQQDKAQSILRLLRERFPLIDPYPEHDTRDPLETSMWQAAAFGLARDVDLALWLHASPNTCNLAGVSALCIACEKGHEKVVYTLLRYGANPNVTPSPLEAALRGKGKRTERIVRLLLGFGANPNGGEQPMLLLARTPQLIRLLLAAGAQVNASSASPAFVSTALHRHARRGKTACVQALLEAGADTEARNIHGMTALHLAIARGKMECVRALLAAGADINARDRHGNTPLMTAFSHRRLPIFRELLRAGADTSIRDCGGRSIDDDIRREEERDSGRVQAFRRRRENLI